MRFLQLVVFSAVSAFSSWGQGSAYFPPNTSSTTRIRVLDGSPVNGMANPGAYQITGSTITVEAWIYPVELPGAGQQHVIVRRIAAGGGDPSNTYSVDIRNDGGGPRLTFELTDGVTSTSNPHVFVQDTGLVAINAWTHVAGTYDGSVAKLYRNGNLVATDTFSVSIGFGTTGFYIGGFIGLSSEGLIDDVRLWNVTRSESAIQTAMNSTLAGNEPGLAGYWRLDEAPGSTVAIDQTSNHNDLSVQSGATFVTGAIGGNPAIPIVLKRSFADVKLPVNFKKYYVGHLPDYFSALTGSLMYGVANLSSGVNAVISADSLYLTSTAGFIGDNSIIVSADNGTSTTRDTFDVQVQNSSLRLVGHASTQLPRITDVWGYVDSASGKEYALIGGGYDGQGISFFDVTDASNPRFVTTLPVDGFDIKTWKKYVYCAGGGSGGSGEVVDMSDPENPVVVGSFPNAHNIWIDKRGYLYGEYASAGSAIICNLNANPLNPPVIWNSPDGGDGHDATVIDTIFYDFHGYNKTTNIYGVSNPAAPVLLGSINYPGMSYNHSGWPTEDRHYLYVCDELATGTQKDVLIWDISDLNNPSLVGSITDTNTIVHNLYIRGQYAYVSWYNSGLRIYDIANPVMPVLVAQYDTYPQELQNYNGAFGVYIFAPSGKIYVSDEPGGLFIFEFDSAFVANQAPTVVQPIPNLILNPNFGRIPAANLNNVFSDPDGPGLTFDFGIIDSGVTVDISNDSLYLSSLVDFEGTSTLWVSAFDGEFIKRDTFQVVVTSALQAPTVGIAIFQNPGLTKYGDILVTSDIALDTVPAVSVTPPGGPPVNITMTEIEGSKRFRGRYTFSTSGSHTVSVSAVTFQNFDTMTTRSFNASFVKSADGGLVSTLSGRAGVRFYEDALSENAFVVALEEPSDLTDVVEFHAGSELTRDVGIEFRVEPEAVSNPSKLFIFQEIDEAWVRLPTVLLKSQHQLKAHAPSLGAFKVVYDEAYSGSNTLINDFQLSQNYPNPFNPSTTIAFDLADDGNVSLIVYNLLGQKVRTLWTGFQTTGRYQFQWDARNDAGSRVASGIYLYRLQAGHFIKTKKMVLIK